LPRTGEEGRVPPPLARPPERGGCGLDALWNDDFHHSAVVALTGHNEGYYSDFLGTPQELLSAVKWGYLYHGQYYSWQKQRRGYPSLDIEPARFVTYIENHDQVANAGRGLRLHRLTSPGRHRALTTLLLLAPSTPLLFQGQEFASDRPFFFFADHSPELAPKVFAGRNKFLAQFRTLGTPEMQACLPNPCDPQTFERSKLDFEDRRRHEEIYLLHRDLLRLRREDPVFRLQRPRGVDGAVLGGRALALRYFADDGADRLLIVNLGRDLRFSPAPEPLLAPPENCAWAAHWSSDAIRYGPWGAPPLPSVYRR